MKRSIDWIRLRLRICFDQHKSCALQSDGAAIPTRLIDVDPDGKGLDIKEPNGLDVKLRESISISPETSPKYAALSYCWGSYRPDCITTSQTIMRNLGRILWDSLPQTFRDAVEFTRRLGLRYLWIDSICIIQGDQDDRSREAGKMYEVYKGATITLAALFGADSRSGLRHMMMSQHYPRIVANLQYGYYVDPLYLRRHHDFWDLGATKEGSYPVISPLLKRAWTYQERIISPRVVFFTESEVVYQCTQEVQCECGTATDAWRTNWKSDSERAMIFEATKPSPDLNQQASSDRKRNVFRTWRAIIEKYSALDITDAKDRLPALGAIAEQFQRVYPTSRYLAGLWSDFLLKDLLWKGDHSKRISNIPTLPTWSWASVQGGVKYPYLLDSFSSYKLRDVAEVVKATCSYRDNRLGFWSTAHWSYGVDCFPASWIGMSYMMSLGRGFTGR
ncbi:heterokaryon incompatibility protein-domain-containing protein [Phyllosticta capitalensis]